MAIKARITASFRPPRFVILSTRSLTDSSPRKAQGTALRPAHGKRSGSGPSSSRWKPGQESGHRDRSRGYPVTPSSTASGITCPDATDPQAIAIASMTARGSPDSCPGFPAAAGRRRTGSFPWGRPAGSGSLRPPRRGIGEAPCRQVLRPSERRNERCDPCLDRHLHRHPRHGCDRGLSADTRWLGVHSVARVWARLVLSTARVRWTARYASGIDSVATALYMANHQSQLDIPALSAAMPAPFRFVAKRELLYVPSSAWRSGLAGSFMIKRGDRHRAIQSLNRAASTLRRGASVIVFRREPEAWTDTFFRSRRGVRAGHKRRRPLVPVSIRGVTRSSPREACVSDQARWKSSSASLCPLRRILWRPRRSSCRRCAMRFSGDSTGIMSDPVAASPRDRSQHRVDMGTLAESEESSRLIPQKP